MGQEGGVEGWMKKDDDGYLVVLFLAPQRRRSQGTKRKGEDTNSMSTVTRISSIESLVYQPPTFNYPQNTPQLNSSNANNKQISLLCPRGALVGRKSVLQVAG